MQHINTSLPPVGIKILVLYNNEWVLCQREKFLVSKKSTPVEFKQIDPISWFSLPIDKIQWSLP